MKNKSIQVGSIVKIGDTAWKVVKRDGFTLGIEPSHAAPDGRTWRTQYVDVSMVKA